MSNKFLLITLVYQKSTHEGVCGYCSDVDPEKDVKYETFSRKHRIDSIPVNLCQQSEIEIKNFIGSKIDLKPVYCNLGSSICGCKTVSKIKNWKFKHNDEVSSSWRRRNFWKD